MNSNKQLIRFNNAAGFSFQDILRKRIENFFKESKTAMQGNSTMRFKTIFYISWLGINYFFMICSSNSFSMEVPLYVLFGLGSAFFVMNVAHDASHHAYSRNKKVNKLLSYSWNLVGMSSYMWELKHNSSHHTFTNVMEHDGDISQSKLVRLNPGLPLKWFHRFQFIYAPFAYSLLSIFIVFIKDFMMFGQHRFGNKEVNHPFSEWLVLIFTKLFYCLYMILIPAWLLPFTWMEIMICFVVMHLVIGITIAMILTPPHINSNTWYVSPDENGTVQNNWFVHQVETTIDFAAGSRLAAWLTGGLNTHVAHHLYPGICHIHYIHITPIIAATAKEFGINYYNRTFYEAVIEHIKFLRILGKIKTINNIR